MDELAKENGLSIKKMAEKLQPGGAIYWQMDEPDVQRVLKFPATMIGSDGLFHDLHPHPRLWGTFPRVLGHYSRDLKLFSLQSAIHKMTHLPATTFGLKDRGLLEEEKFADIVIFDPHRIRDTATFQIPKTPSEGIFFVLVNGQIVYQNQTITSNRPGRLCKKISF